MARRWRQWTHRYFTLAAVLACAGLVGAFVLPAGRIVTIATATGMCLVAGFVASGTYCLGRAHVLDGLRATGTDQPQ
ncbi:hypothetical protein [Amycolatopsis sp. cg9]|uniref:hypothetical protein n=1 Tax=Amycolatopsis sp. cg9 TaxID=3238801 RepID=UPI0035242169